MGYEWNRATKNQIGLQTRSNKSKSCWWCVLLGGFKKSLAVNSCSIWQLKLVNKLKCVCSTSAKKVFYGYTYPAELCTLVRGIDPFLPFLLTFFQYGRNICYVTEKNIRDKIFSFMYVNCKCLIYIVFIWKWMIMCKAAHLPS